MRRKTSAALFAGALLMAVTPALAHHWFPTGGEPAITLSGKVTKISWINPHARVFIDVKASNGKVENWEIEAGAPSALILRGWKRDALKVGDNVTVEGLAVKGTPRMAVAANVQLPDGRRVFAGSHAGDFEKKK